MARILIVDDQPDLREALAAVVEYDGHDVIQESNGRDLEATVVAAQPDVVLLDWNMPGVVGVEALRRLKANPATKHIPVIMITVHDQPETRDQAAMSGAASYITKPWGDGEVGLRVNQALQNSRSSGGEKQTALGAAGRQ
ncbi:MAG: response regulator [Chloroflexi bacterium]|nr:response regulator [Chloroflexota bacterium]